MNNKFIRIIPKLDIKNGLLIKSINLDGLRVLGDPYDFAKLYYDMGADEIFYSDVVASLYGTINLSKYINRISKSLFIPLTVSGGIKTLNQIEEFLKNGADKISINTEAINNISLIKKASRVFGSSTIVSNIQSIKIENKYFITKENGREIIKENPVKWAKKLEDNGVGEIFLTSINKEGLKKGFDLNILKKVSNSVKIPVIAHGGAGSHEQIYQVIKNTNISGVAISGFFHYAVCNSFKTKKFKLGNTYFIDNLTKEKSKNVILDLKKYLLNRNIRIRK